MASSRTQASSPSSQRPRPRTAALTSLLLPMSLMFGTASAVMNCDSVIADGHKFDFSPLKGPHSVVTSATHLDGMTNVTYTLDICQPLKRNEGVDKGDECPNGTWVCGIWHHIKAGVDQISQVRPIAGNIDGRTLDQVFTRLSTSASEKDKGKQGVRIVLQGGKYDKKQKAIVEMLCKEGVEGTEGEIDLDKDLSKPSSAAPQPTTSSTSTSLAARALPTGAAAAAADDDNKDKTPVPEGPVQILKPDAALIWESYGPSDEDPNHVEVLKLTWHTKHACEKRSEDGAKDESKSWGFFTWVILLVFLGAAAYIIFGSWLNYTRYGARGWDLLPHGDTIRDIPYLLQDWVRRLMQTLQGGGSRGGYSAV